MLTIQARAEEIEEVSVGWASVTFSIYDYGRNGDLGFKHITSEVEFCGTRFERLTLLAQWVLAEAADRSILEVLSELCEELGGELDVQERPVPRDDAAI
jgi:hypothetical protein